MRQFCNVSLAVQLEGKNEAEVGKFVLELNHPPPGWARRAATPSFVDPGLLALMGGET